MTAKPRSRNRILLTATGLLLAGASLVGNDAALGQGDRATREPRLALVGGTIYPSPTDEPIRNGVVLIQQGKIVAVGTKRAVKIGRDDEVVDCSGTTITAGFYNAHVHFSERKWANAATIPAPELERQLQDMLTRHGFTGAFDLSSEWENTRRIRDRVESGEVSGPRIRSTGEGLIPPGALPPDLVFTMMGFMKTPLPEITDGERAAKSARKLLDAGVDGIKLFASSPSGVVISEEAVRAAASEARRSGKPVFVHPNNDADVLTAIRGGADIVAHTTPRSGPWDEALPAAMKERNVALIPTLSLWKFYLRHDRVSARDKTVDAAVGQLRAWVAVGGTVLFGTDLGAVDPDPTEEYLLMAEAGMTFRQILASLTTAPAERFGDARRLGRIAPGLAADLVVLDQDPAKDVRALASVRCTLRDGKMIYRTGK